MKASTQTPKQPFTAPPPKAGRPAAWPAAKPAARPLVLPVALLLLFWLLPALACNYPGAARQPGGLSEQALRQTLQAQPYATPGLQTSIPDTTPSAFPSPSPSGLSAFPGLNTATPASNPGTVPQVPAQGGAAGGFLYYAQAGDTLPTLARRFGVEVQQIAAAQELPSEGLISPGTQLNIPDVLGQAAYPSALLPDSEVVYSPAAVAFQAGEFIDRAGGYLSAYEEAVENNPFSGAEIIQRVALEYSINPRLLLAFLEYRSGWVTGQPDDPKKIDHPIGYFVPGYQGLYLELALAAKHLNMGYYGWRAGTLLELEFPDGRPVRIGPELNAGSVAVQFLFSKFYKQDGWVQALYGTGGFPALYTGLFSDPWERAASVEPLFPAGISQPTLELPFQPGERWSLTGGPHITWTTGTPAGALDFAPVTGEPACVVSRAWVTASAAGVVTRSGADMLAIDLDGDGLEQTGWVLFYMHIADKDRVPPGSRVELDQPLGHPSCESGRSTGTHVHMARKYNGEWLAADGGLPFVLSGWRAIAGARPYQGSMARADQVVYANPGGSRTSILVR